MTAGERIVQNFLQEGVEIIFSHGELSLMDIQMHALKQGMRMVGPRHESAGVFMAAAYYRMTGKPQVAMGAQGPGAANMLPGAINCRDEHIAVVLVGASRQHESTTGVRTGRFLHSDTVFPAFNEVCKWAGKILHPRQVDEMIQHAFREAMNGTPGPVYLEVDYEGHQQTWDYDELVPPLKYRLFSQPASTQSIDDAVRLIKSARSPLILAGEEVQSTRTFDALHTLSRLVNCPVTNPMTARGVMKESDDHFINFSSDTIKEVIAASDLVIAVGTRIPEHINYGRQRHWAEGDATRKWIMLHQDPSAFGVNRPIDVPVLGKLPDVLPQLIAALQKAGPRPSHPKLEGWRKGFMAERQQRIDDARGKFPIHPYELMAVAREAVPDEAVIVTECGLTGVYLNDAFEQRSNDYLWNVTFGLMGAGLPHAIGAKLAVGNRPVCLVTGDGGIGPHIMELETAVRHRVPIVIIVNDDQSYAAELAALNAKMKATPEARFAYTRFDKLIEAVGGHGEYVENIKDLPAAIERAIASGLTALVQVRVDQDSGLKYIPFGNAELFSWVHEDPACQRG
jgi:thiamine pyrophosphate-dependent acetolactate synthase large subunit-like protein